MQKYGQHFLISDTVLTQITDAALLLRAVQVVEIGPGKGALTLRLLARGVSLTAVEIDPEMSAHLQNVLPAAAQLNLITADFLAFDLSRLPAVPTEFVGNLPYIDAAAILDKVLSWPHFAAAVFMFQKEQAQKICAPAGGALYGPLSVLAQLRAEISWVCDAGRGCFAPPPKVESRVLAFQKLKTPVCKAQDWEKTARLVKNAFLHKRKTLFNSLSLAGYGNEKLTAAFAALSLGEKIRPEAVTPAQYAQLARHL